jgi:hypothetical protein
VTDDRAVDQHLVAVLNDVLDAVYQSKQAAWAASTSPAREDLQELVSFLIEQSGLLMVAEERIDGRSAAVFSPSSYQRGNLLAEARGDLTTALSLLAHRLQAIVDDARARARAMPEVEEATLLADLSKGLEARIRGLGPG